jgi:hypothetical protein
MATSFSGGRSPERTTDHGQKRWQRERNISIKKNVLINFYTGNKQTQRNIGKF